MSESQLPVVVVGVGGAGQLTLESLTALDDVEVVGVSDRNPELADQAAEQFGTQAYTDNRSLLVETRPAIAFLCLPPRFCPELVTLCAEQGTHVWKELPLARSLEEAAQMVSVMEQAKLKFAVGTQRRFSPPYRRAQMLRDRLQKVFLARAHYLFNWGPELDWRADRASAGGGALLELGYHFLDLLVWILGMPEEVYGMSTCGNRPDDRGPAGQPLPPYDTDDTAGAILRYKDGCMATLVTTRRSGPVSEGLDLHGKAGSITATSGICLLREPDGGVLDRVSDPGSPMEIFRRQAHQFIQAVQSETGAYDCSGLENLLTMATIDAIYLSDRTAQPENPARLLSAANFKPDQCLRHRPVGAPAWADQLGLPEG